MNTAPLLNLLHAAGSRVIESVSSFPDGAVETLPRPVATLDTLPGLATRIHDAALSATNPAIVKQALARASLAPDAAERLIALQDFYPVVHQGDTCVLRVVPHMPHLLVSEFCPTVFSYAAQGVIEVPGLEFVRAKIHELLADELHRARVPTATLHVLGKHMLVTRERVPNLEVVVKAWMGGSTVHKYGGITDSIAKGTRHGPDVRFDWRQKPPADDEPMSDDQANRFIDVRRAKALVRRAFLYLQQRLKGIDLELLDGCFFVNESGQILVSEISTDNLRFVYIGKDPELQRVFDLKAPKELALAKAEALLGLLEGTYGNYP